MGIKEEGDRMVNQRIRTRRNDLIAIRTGLREGAISLDVYRTLRTDILDKLSYWRWVANTYGVKLE